MHRPRHVRPRIVPVGASTTSSSQRPNSVVIISTHIVISLSSRTQLSIASTVSPVSQNSLQSSATQVSPNLQTSSTSPVIQISSSTQNPFADLSAAPTPPTSSSIQTLSNTETSLIDPVISVLSTAPPTSSIIRVGSSVATSLITTHTSTPTPSASQSTYDDDDSTATYIILGTIGFVLTVLIILTFLLKKCRRLVTSTEIGAAKGRWDIFSRFCGARTTTPFHLSETERERERERSARRNPMHEDENGVTEKRVFPPFGRQRLVVPGPALGTALHENRIQDQVISDQRSINVIESEDFFFSYNASDENLVRAREIDWASQPIEEAPGAGGQRRDSSENPFVSEDDDSMRSTNKTLVS
ncbi:hypothetical protein JB92DRAFT_1750032 [Gautieria morchelliformis]|nr:hypothetical protein JB92DRAFT_1750032 [Gautieria morchelliformis]